MAKTTKKKPAKKPATKASKKTAAKPKTRTGAKARKPVAVKARPKNQPLPGMEQVRNPALSKTCGTIADIREQINELKTQEKTALGVALAQMKGADVVTFTDHGVELFRTTTEKLRVRLVDDSNAGGEDDDAMDLPDQGDLGDMGEAGEGSGE